MMTFKLAEVKERLMRTFDVAEDEAPAFEAKLKQLQRCGFPIGVNVGRRAKVSYSHTHLIQLGVCIALMRLGVTPSRAISDTNGHFAYMLQSLIDTDMYWIASPASFGFEGAGIGIDLQDLIRRLLPEMPDVFGARPKWRPGTNAPKEMAR